MRAYVQIGRKPRLIKVRSGLWACHGVRNFGDWLFRKSQLVTGYGETPAMAYNSWKLRDSAR
jgi:hypothetical protein